MDKSKLIDLIRESPCLWDLDYKFYHLKEVREQKWKEIAEKLNVSCVEVKVTWKNLRDNYKRELKRKCNNSQNNNIIIKWPYFKQLLFLSGIKHFNKDTREVLIQVCKKKNIWEEKEYERSVCVTLSDHTLKRKVSKDDTNVASKQFKLNPNIGLETPNFLYNEEDNCCFIQVCNEEIIGQEIEYEKNICDNLNRKVSKEDTQKTSKQFKLNDKVSFEMPNLHIEDDNYQFVQVCNEEFIGQENEYEKTVCDNLNNHLFTKKVPEDDTQKTSKEFKLNDKVSFEKPSLHIEDDNYQFVQVCNKKFIGQENKYEKKVCDNLNNHLLKRKVSEDETQKSSKQFNLNTKVSFEKSNLHTDDDDYHFILSLLPFLRRVPGDRKLGVRMSIIGTIEQELEMVQNFSEYLNATQYKHDLFNSLTSLTAEEPSSPNLDASSFAYIQID